MTEAMDFWNMSYENGWFVRLSIVDKTVSTVIGTVELCLRVSEDEFNNMGILRVDVRSDYEQENELYGILSLITPELEKMLGCKGVLTKAPIYAVERIKAIQKVGFTKSEHLLIGKQDMPMMDIGQLSNIIKFKFVELRKFEFVEENMFLRLQSCRLVQKFQI